MLHYVHSSFICNSQKLEITQMSLNRRMDTENVVHVHNYSAIKKNITNFADKWMELENIILSDVTSPQQDIHDRHSLIS